MRRPSNLIASPTVAKPSPARPEPAPPTNYLDLYGLSKPPFGHAADNAGYILFSSHTRAFDLLTEHLIKGSGLIILQGDGGIGKTETLRAAATVAGEAGVQTIAVFRPPDGRISLMQLIAALAQNPAAVTTEIDDTIKRFFDPPRKALLIDDTDLAPEDCVRLLLSLVQRAAEDPQGPAIILSKSTDLVPDASQPDLSRLIAIARNTVRLSRLGFAEIRQYIERSLWIAGGTTRRLIASDAMKLIITRSDGLPGMTNRMMEAVLAAGFARGDTMITAKTVAAATGPAPSRPQPSRSFFARPDPAKSPPVQPQPVQPPRSQPQLAQRHPSPPQPAQPQPLQSQPVEPHPSQTPPLRPYASRPDKITPTSSGVAGRAMQIVAIGLLVTGASVFLYKGLNGDLGSQTLAPPEPIPAARLNPQPPAAAVTSPPQPESAARPANALPPALVAALMTRGDQSLALGDIVAARLLFRRAAEDGNGSAATALGKTYDPAYITQGQPPDPARAREWYEKATKLGDPNATVLLQQLGKR